MPRNKGESDVFRDPQTAASRDTGGVSDPSAPDQSSTTGTSRTGQYVGRVAGDDVGYEDETGAERRGEAADSREEEQ